MTESAYSPRHRTAVLLCGTGTAGYYQAGVLRGLAEAGVKIDVVAGHGPGVANALCAAIDGDSRLWDDAGPWSASSLRRSYRWRTALRLGALGLGLALALLLLAPAAMSAQGLPAYRPINPVAASRSGLGFEPFHVPVPGRWQADVGVEYASTIEYNQNDGATYYLDSELFRARATVYRDLTPAAFLLAEAELLGAYGGVLDGFLEWYHDLLGIEIPERERRPRNDFLYLADLPDRSPLLRRPGDRSMR